MTCANAQESQEPDSNGILKVEKTGHRKRQHFGDTLTADHTVLNEENESRWHHRDAVVVQDLVSQWIQSCPCAKQDCARYDEMFAAILTSRKQAWSDLH